MDILKMEWTKLSHRKSLRVLLVLYLVVVIGLSLVYLVGEKTFGLSIFNQGQFVSSSLKVMMMFLLPFMGLYLSANSFGMEISQGTLKNMLLLPFAKESLYLSKMAVLSLYMGLLLTIQFLYSSFFSLLLDGSFAISLLPQLLGEYLGAWLILNLIIFIGGGLSMLISSTGLVLIVAYLFYMGFTILTIYLPRIATISPSTLLGNYQFLTGQGGFTQLLSILAYYIIVILSGYLLFDRKEEGQCLYE